MNLAIIGSRTFNDYELLKQELKPFLDDNEIKDNLKIVSGGAKGADTLGERWAKENNIEILIYLADWNKYGKKAGFMRNYDIIKNCEAVIAFWDGISKGTAHSLKLAKEQNKFIKIIKV